MGAMVGVSAARTVVAGSHAEGKRRGSAVCRAEADRRERDFFYSEVQVI